MAWNHKGVAIELQGASFVAEIGGKRVSLSSLNAVKKAIDKHQTAKAQEVTLNVPVVARMSKGRYYRDREAEPDRIWHGVITGIDPQSMTVTGVTAPDGWSLGSLYHDTTENVARLERAIAAEAEEKAAREALDGRSISRSFAGRIKYGKPSTTYGEAVALFNKSCEEAKKGKGAE